MGTELQADAEPRLLFRFEKKTDQSVQGLAVSGDFAFQMFHTGICSVYDLAAKSGIPVDTFHLASYNAGDPDRRYANHANQAMFSGVYHEGNFDFPLLYVTTGNSGETDRDGYIARCAVEDISKSPDEKGGIRFASRLIQTIVYCNDGIEHTHWETPGWGFPASFADSDGGWYYLFSARYRTTREFEHLYRQNAYIITKFRLPAPTKEFVRLTPGDIADQFTAGFDILFTQGGTLYKNKIYYTFGAGKPHYPNGIRVFNLETKRIETRLDLSRSIFADEELESCAVHRGTLLCTTQAARFYQFDHFEDLMSDPAGGRAL